MIWVKLFSTSPLDRMHYERTHLKANICILMTLLEAKFNKWAQYANTIAGANGPGDKLFQLNEPQAIFVDEFSSMYVVDHANHRVVQWKWNAKQGEVIAGGNGKGKRLDQLHGPTDVIVNQQNYSYIIADQGNKRVIRWLRYNQQEILIENINCYGLAIDKHGNLYVSDTEKNEVRKWKIGEKEKEGVLVAGGNGEGDQLNQLSSPTYIVVDDAQSIYISDTSNNRVIKWKKGAREGVIIAGGNGHGDDVSQLYDPSGLILDRWGRIYVSDHLNHRIVRWCEGSSEGEIIVCGNGRGEKSNQLYRPTGLSFDIQGNLFVSDHYNERIQKFDRILQ